MNVVLTEDDDLFVWKLTTSGVFTVKSLYTDMMRTYSFLIKIYLEIKGTTKN